MLAAIAAAFLLGVSGGLTPGPLLTFVIAQTLRHGAAEGTKVAFVPIVTDSPLIVIGLIALPHLAHLGPLLGALSLIGSAFLIYLAWQTWRVKAVDAAHADEAPRSIRRGILVNLTNPNPYLFWFTVGVPTLVKAAQHGWTAAAAFVAIFFVLLIGCQVLLAVLVARSREHVAGRWYAYAMRGLAVMLLVFAIFRARDGITLLR
jgi:threonine/homoserine/homoserine lactone efflux protein